MSADDKRDSAEREHRGKANERRATSAAGAGEPEPKAATLRPGRALRITRHAPDVTRDVADEVEFHLQMRTEELIAQGMEPAAARRAAADAFGNRGAVESETRRITEPEVRREQRAEVLDASLRDLRFALRGLWREPGFAVVAVLTLALCLGANVAVFAVVNGVVLRPLPFPDADRIVTFYNAYPGSGVERTDNSVPDYFDRGESMATIGGEGASSNVFVSRVSPPFFDVLGVAPALGRGFNDDDGVVGRNTNIVVSHGFWQSYFGGADDVLGRTVEIEGSTFTVIGVMPADFGFVTWDAQVWFSFAFPEEMRDAYHRNSYAMIGRLREGATVEQAQQELDALNAGILAAYPPEGRRALAATGYHSIVRGWQDDLLRDFRAPLYLLWASVALVLLIGAFNIANLMLLRLSTRMRELSTRFVLGASRWRLTRQLFIESLVLTLVGGVVALALAAWSLRFVDLFEHYQVPRLGEVAADTAMVGFTLLVSLLVAAVAAILPVIVVRRGDLFGAFRGAVAPSSGHSPGHRALSLRGVLVGGQVAAAFVVVATGALLLSSLLNLWSVDPGFDVDNLVAGAILLTPDRYENGAARAAFRDRVVDAIEGLPGVSRAAFASQLPFSGQENRNVLVPEDYVHGDDEAIEAHPYTSVSPGYFETMNIPLLAGRDLDRRDDAAAIPVVVIDEHLARRYWGSDSPLGRRVAFNVQPAEDEVWFTVVGVVGSIVQNELDETERRGAYYLPASQTGEQFFRLVARTEIAEDEALAQVRETLQGIDPQMPFFWTTTMNGAIAERLIPRRIPMMVVMAFSAVALLLTTLGVYGVLAYGAAQRTKEFGIRIALGSSPGRIYKLMFGDALLIIGGGIVVGVVGAQFLNRLLANQLYEIQPRDPWVLGLVALTIGAVGLLACLAPTRRATRVDPMVALRDG